MRTIETKGSIVIKNNGLIYNICTLIQTVNGEDFSYTFIPNREIIALLPRGLFQGIQGINLDLGQDKYYRDGLPTFVSERVPPKNREGLYELLNKAGLDYYDPLAFMIKSKYKYFGDNLEVVDFIETKSVDVAYMNMTNLYNSIKKIVANIALNNEVIVDGYLVDKKSYFEMLYPIYLNLYFKKVEVQRRSAAARRYEGRRPIYIDEEEFRKVLFQYKNEQISLNEALNILGISRSTFIRRSKLCQN